MSELEFSEKACAHLRRLQEHPCAPRYNHQSSDLLNKDRLADVQRFQLAVLPEKFWEPGQLPEWMPEFLERVFHEVPYYSDFGDAPTQFEAIPTVDRTVLARGVERFVPDSVPLSEITVYFTSGTSGKKLQVPTDAGVSSKVPAMMGRLLAPCGVSLPKGAEKVAVAVLFFQKETLTYPSLSHYLQGAATLKLNLHPDQWRDPKDRGEYLRACAPKIVAGCPQSLASLIEVAPDFKPEAIFSSAVTLTEGFRETLRATFDCPIFDIYGLTEAKFIAARGEQNGWDLVSPDLYVEILDPEGRARPAGVWGEITLTGGRNRCLPLVRYRTGDFGALEFRGSQPYLSRFQGRPEVRLVDGQARPLSRVDVAKVLSEFPLFGFTFHQNEDATYRFCYTGEASERKLAEAISQAFGLQGEVERVSRWEGKSREFSSDLDS